MSEKEAGKTLLDAAIRAGAIAWLSLMEERVTNTYHFLADVTEDEFVLYDKSLAKQIEILEGQSVPLPTAIAILKRKREFVRLLMFFRTEVANRCPRPADQAAAKESLNDEHLSWLMRRQPEQ